MLLPGDLVEEFSLEHRERDRPLVFHWRTLDFERIHALGVPHHTNKNARVAWNSILAEAVLAHDEGRWVSYSRRKEHYAGLRRYHGTGYTYATILPIIDELISLDLIEEERSAPRQRGWQSRFRATPLLVEGLANALFEYELHGLIRLKDADGKLIDFRETDETRRHHRELAAINEFLSSINLELAAPDSARTRHHLVVDGAHYRPTPTPVLYRVFNRSSFRSGGRAYAWWQSLPKRRRRELLIGGEPVAEPDFVQMHPSILYARRGHRLKGDAYETGEFSRDDGKLAFNVALNAKTLPGAMAALLNKDSWTLPGRETSRLIELLKRRNAPIADDLHADQGVKLMRLDSEITLRAVMECAKADIPALPVHDSMLTPKHYESRVAEIMEKSAARVLKAVNPCSVKVSGYSVPQMPSPCPISSLSPSRRLGDSTPVQLDLFSDRSAPSFSLQIRALRDRLGLSQHAFGEKIGCSQSHIANVEHGRDGLGDWSRRRLHDLMLEAA